MICPYCEQGAIIWAKVKRDERVIQICEECDTVWNWNDKIDEADGMSFDEFMLRYYKSVALWDELNIESL